MDFDTDHLIIGSGPGGEAAAQRLAELGATRVTVVENGPVGGTCVNWGCIPTHFILEHLLMRRRISETIARHGLFTNCPELDPEALKSATDRVIENLRQTIQQNLEHHNIEFIHGNGRIVGPHRAEITVEDGTVISRIPETIIVASGAPFSGLEVKGMATVEGHLVRADRAISLALDDVPETLVVYGLDSPAVELAVLFHLRGSRVTLLSPGSSVLSYGGPELARTVEDSLEFHDIEIRREVRLEEFGKTSDRLRVTFEESGSSRGRLECDRFINAWKRQSNTECIRGLTVLQEDGRPKVSEGLRSSIDHVYFLGDVRSGNGVPFRSHLAAFSGRLLAERLMGRRPNRPLDLKMIPRGMATLDFQVAAIGLTEQEARNEELDVRTFHIPNTYNAYARILGQVSGYAQLVVEQESGRVLGGEIISPDAINLITLVGSIMACEGKIQDLRTFPAFHPSLSEAILDCAWLA